MNNNVKVAKIGCGISAVAVLISVISMFISQFGGYSITILFCMISIFFSNLLIYLKQNRKNNDTKK